MEKKKILKILLLCVMFILIIFAITIIRNIVIFSKIQSLISKYEKSTNLYAKIDYENSTFEISKLDNNEKIVMKYKEKPIKMIQMKHNNEEIITYTFYTQTNEVNISNQNKNMLLQEESIVKNFAKTNSFFQKIDKSINSKITLEKINGKEYYVIDSMENSNYYSFDNLKSVKAYVSKETGLPLKLVGTTTDGVEHLVNYEYEFEKVTPEDFALPDIAEYKEK